MESPKSDRQEAFRNLLREAREEPAPEIDVSFEVRQALMALRSKKARTEIDWMEALIRVFSAKSIRVATTMGLLFFSITTSVLLMAGTSTPSAGTTSDSAESQDLIATFLIEGDLS